MPSKSTSRTRSVSEPASSPLLRHLRHRPRTEVVRVVLTKTRALRVRTRRMSKA